MLPLVVGSFLTMVQMWLVFSAQQALPMEVIELANQSPSAKGLIAQAFELWNRFNPDGHRIITESLTTVLCLAPAIVLNLGYGVRYLCALHSEHSRSCALLAQRLEVFKSWGGAMSPILTIAAFLTLFGVFTPNT